MGGKRDLYKQKSKTRGKSSNTESKSTEPDTNDQQIVNNKNNDDFEVVETDQLGTVMERLQTKRRSERERGWKELSSFLRSAWRYEEVERFEETLAGLALQAMGSHKSSQSESAAAAAALPLLVLTVGGEGERLFAQLLRECVDWLSDRARSAAVRCSVALSLSLSCFLVGDSEESHALCKVLVSDGLRAAGDDLACTCLSGLALLCSVEPMTESEDVDAMMAAVAAGLQTNSLNTRAAAGHLLALLYTQSKGELDVDDDVWDQLEELASGNDKRQSRKFGSEQRRVFRRVLSTLEDVDEQPEETQTVGSQTHRWQGWAQVVQYLQLKAALAGGWQRHLVENPVYGGVWGASFSLRSDRLNKLEKAELRMEQRLNKKDAKLSRDKARRNKTNQRKNLDDVL